MSDDKSTVDSLIDFGAGFDWITPLAQMLSGRSWLTVTCHEEWWPIIEQERTEYGFRIRNVFWSGGEYCFQLHEDDQSDFLSVMGGYGWPQ